MSLTGISCSVVWGATEATIPDNIAYTLSGQITYENAEWLGVGYLETGQGPYNVWWTTTLIGVLIAGHSVYNAALEVGHYLLFTTNSPTTPHTNYWRYDDPTEPLVAAWTIQDRRYFSGISDMSGPYSDLPTEFINTPFTQALTFAEEPIVEPTYYPGNVISVAAS